MDAQSKLAARSCTTCAKAKAKCVRQPEQVACERCARLKKDCFMREPAIRKKKQQIKATRAAQLEKLENKIESLVNALSGSQSQGQQGENGNLSPPASNTSQASPGDRNVRTAAEIFNSLCLQNGDSLVSSRTPGGNPAEGPSPSGSTPDKPHGVTPSEAEMLVDRFQRLMAPGFPFVVLPKGATARSLIERRPFLLRAIISVAMFSDLPRQEAMVTDFIRELAERVMIKSQRSIDVLQGILVFTCWYYPHVFSRSQTTNLLHLAIAQTIDLGIDRPPQLCPDFKSVTARAVHGPSLIGRIPHLDEHRALLGTFYLAAVLSCCLKKVEPMPPTKYMEDCANSLQEAAEYDSDLVLVQMFRMQAVCNSIHATTAPAAPMDVYIRAFSADIEKLRKSNPCKEDNVILRMQDLTSEMSMWALALNELNENRRKPLNMHLDDLHRCMTAGKSLARVFLSVPATTYPCMPFAVFGYYAQMLIMLIRLASLEMEGWDLKVVNRELGFLQICDESAKRFEEITDSTLEDFVINNDAFRKWGGKVRWMKQVYLAKFAQETDDIMAVDLPDSDEQPAKTAALMPTESRFGQPTPPDEIMSLDMVNLMDDNFWNSFVTDFDFGYIESQVT